MKKHRLASRMLARSLAAIPLALCQAVSAQSTAVWTGPSSGNFGTAANWDIGQVPLNAGANHYIVQIGSGKAVAYNTTGARAIDQLLLDLNSSLNLSSSSLILPTDLTVLGPALVAGAISVNQASFSALAAGSRFLGNATTVAVSNGSVFSMAATDYSAKGITGGTLLSASGAGSRLSLASVQVLDVGAPVTNFAYTNRIVATDRAVVDLSGVRSTVAPAFGAGTLAFSVTSGASLNLSSLQQIAGPTQDSGNTSITADSGTVTLGPLQKVNRLSVSLQNGATLSAGGFAGIADITGSTLAVASGARINAATLRANYNARSFTGDTLFSATGDGSLLNLAGLLTIDSGAPVTNFVYANTIRAADKAVINLSGVKSLLAPSFSAGSLNFDVSGGARLDLASVQEIGGVTLDSGNTRFNADGGSIALGPLQKANRLNVSLSNGALMSVGGFAGTALLSNTSLSVSSGARLDAATLRADLGIRGFTGGVFLSATGDGSLLGLSGLQTLDSGAPVTNFAYANTVSATDKAVVDLSGVKSLIAPAFGAGTLAFNLTGGARLSLASVQQIGGVTLDSGYTSITADGSSIVLGPLQRANRLNINLRNGATLSAGGFAGTADISGSTFVVASGAQLNAASLRANYNAKDFTGATLLSATGAGSLLNLAGLQTVDASAPATNFVYANSIAASDKAVIDLSGVRLIVAPAFSAGSLNFNASGGARINLAALQTLDTRRGGQVNFDASSGGQLQFGGLSAGPAVHFNLRDTGSQMSVAGNLALLAGSTMVAGAGTRIDIGGSFSFQQVVESQLNLDLATLQFGGAGLQTLEVGGRQLGPAATTAVVRNNFAIGELRLGQASAARVLTLVDAIDNGNRSSPEVLYLNGVAGGKGLHILGGSTLVLGGLDLYTTEGGQWVHVNELFRNGATTIAYDGGFISTVAVPEPASFGLLLAGLGVVAWRSRSRV